jgi:hypothetical protein
VSVVRAATAPASKAGAKEKDKLKRKFSRSDISKPEDFKHVSHIGVDPNTGAVQIPDDWKTVLAKAGVSEVRVDGCASDWPLWRAQGSGR